MAAPLRRADSQRGPAPAQYLPQFQSDSRFSGYARRPEGNTVQRPSALHSSSRPVPQGRRAQEVRFLIPVRSRTMQEPRSNSAHAASRSAGVMSISPLLMRSVGGAATLHFNAEYPAEYARVSTSSVPLSAAHRAQLATSTPLSFMRLLSDPPLPWAIDVSEAASGAGIRIGDVLHAIFITLHRRVRAEEFATLDQRNREKVERAFHARVSRAGPRNARAVHDNGILRLDFLFGRTVFLGIVPTSEPHTWRVLLGHQ